MVDYAIVGGNNYNIVDLGDPDPLSEFPEIYGNENFSYVDYINGAQRTKISWCDCK